ERRESSKGVTCFNYKKLGHVKSDCPLLNVKRKKDKKTTMLVNVSPSEYSSEEEEVEDEEVDKKEMAQMCFMALEEVTSISYSDNDSDNDDDEELDVKEILIEMQKLIKLNVLQKGKILDLENKLSKTQSKLNKDESFKIELEKKNKELINEARNINEKLVAYELTKSKLEEKNKELVK
ncbi:hypothetical protein KN825_15850, partial [Weizmannia coagulans]|nr:hypothetical protein [Heyndrickxia coagulans]